MWRKFAPGGGGIGARNVFDESQESKSAVAEANAVASAAAASVSLDCDGAEEDGGLDVAAEIVSASTFSAAARLRETRGGGRDDERGGGGGGGSSGSGDAGVDALLAKAVGSVLAFQTCADHGVDPALTAVVIERFVSSLKAHCASRAARDALNEVSAAFESLKGLLL